MEICSCACSVRAAEACRPARSHSVALLVIAGGPVVAPALEVRPRRGSGPSEQQPPGATGSNLSVPLGMVVAMRSRCWRLLEGANPGGRRVKEGGFLSVRNPTPPNANAGSTAHRGSESPPRYHRRRENARPLAMAPRLFPRPEGRSPHLRPAPVVPPSPAAPWRAPSHSPPTPAPTWLPWALKWGQDLCPQPPTHPPPHESPLRPTGASTQGSSGAASRSPLWAAL